MEQERGQQQSHVSAAQAQNAAAEGGAKVGLEQESGSVVRLGSTSLSGDVA